MSSEWRTLTLGQLGRIVTGKTPRTLDPNNFGGKIPFVTPTDMGGFKEMTTTTRYLSELGASTVKSSIIPAGAVMVSCIGSDMGKSVIAMHRCVTNQQINSVVVDAQFSREFVYYNLSMRKAELQHLASGGSTMPILNKGMFSEVKIDFPPLAEQQQIAATLSALDDRISLLRETNATLEAIAQALFKSWFVDFDPVRVKLEGRAPAGMDEATAALFPDGFEESELGLVPRGWGYAAIRDVVETVYDGPHATPAEADAGPVFLGIKNLTGTALDLGEIRHIAEAQWQQWTRRVEPQGGDIVFSYEATLGFFALIPNNLRCCLGRRLALVRPKAIDGAGHFWFHQFVAAPFQRLLEKHTIQGATVNRIALKEFPSYVVLNPSLSMQIEFDKGVAPLWLKIHENQAQAQTLATLRDTLLPRLISGQLRLPDAELQFQEATK
jgi:type I restriction enzyme, S subunit